MKWNWIDFNQNLITVKNSETFTTKSKKERVIPICSMLKNCLFSIIPKIVNLNIMIMQVRLADLFLHGRRVINLMKIL